jgi:hypothetical protein
LEVGFVVMVVEVVVVVEAVVVVLFAPKAPAETAPPTARRHTSAAVPVRFCSDVMA